VDWVANGVANPLSIRTARKAAVRAGDGSVIAFPHLSQLQGGLSDAQWRALSPSEKLERLFGMSLDRMAEILSGVRWPSSIPPASTTAPSDRDRQRILEGLTRREFGDDA
jgi:hypothetical protein